MTAFGFDPASFRLDTTVHPFCSSFATSDIRVTTRYSENDLESLYSCMHEIGHGLYERGVSPTLERTPLASGCSSGLHESQSRLWENVVGRSLPFCRWLHPQLVATFPDASPASRSSSSTAPATASSRRSSGSTPTRSPTACTSSSASSSSRSCSRGRPRLPTCPRRGTPASRSTSDRRPRGQARRPAGRPLVVRALRLLPDLPARQRDERADLGGGAGGVPGLDERSSEATSQSSGRGSARTSTRSAAS